MALSLKHKIQFLYAAILGSVLALLGTTFYFYEKEKRLNEIDVSLDAIVPTLIALNREPPRHVKNRTGRIDESGNFIPPGRKIILKQHEEWRRGAQPSSDEGSGTKRKRDRPKKEIIWNLPGWERRDNPRDYVDSNIEEDVIESERTRLDREAGIKTEFSPEIPATTHYACVYSRRSNKIVFRSSHFPDIEMPRDNIQGYHLRFRDNQARELLHGIPNYNVLVGIDLAPHYAELNKLKAQIFGSASLIFVVCLGFGHVLLSRSLRPLKSIRDASVSISSGKLNERISEEYKGNAQEFDVLISELNSSFAQLESLFNRQIRFTADASHELKTPLTILIAQIDLALKGHLTADEYEESFKMCAVSCQRLQRIIEELLEIARYDAGRVELEYQSLLLDEILKSLAEELQAYVQKQGSTLQTNFNSGMVSMDPFRIEQVITNLVNNALQHNETPVTITLRTRIESDRAIIQVMDNGKGIQPKNVDKLFDRFFQESASRTRKSESKNTGLGLAICKAIIELHGGKISVASQPGVETVFTISIPCGANP